MINNKIKEGKVWIERLVRGKRGRGQEQLGLLRGREPIQRDEAGVDTKDKPSRLKLYLA